MAKKAEINNKEAQIKALQNAFPELDSKFIESVFYINEHFAQDRMDKARLQIDNQHLQDKVNSINGMLVQPNITPKSKGMYRVLLEEYVFKYNCKINGVEFTPEELADAKKKADNQEAKESEEALIKTKKQL